MASLNDIETRIQNIIDIIESRVISTITGVLPITFRADGTALIDYRIYGTAEGAGVQTENLFNCELVKGTINSATGEFTNSNERIRASWININGTDDYTFTVSGAESGMIFVYELDGTYKRTESTATWVNFPFTLSISANRKIAVIFRYNNNTEINPTDVTNIMFVKGSTPPSTYVPYGYKIPITITDGTASKDTDIYIGDTKLLSGDYIDYESGKIVRNGTLQDPPLPFTAIDTYIGINTLDSVETLGEVTIKGKIKEVI